MRIDVKIYNDYLDEMGDGTFYTIEKLEKCIERFKTVEIDEIPFTSREDALKHVDNFKDSDNYITWGNYIMGSFEDDEMRFMVESIFDFIENKDCSDY